MKRIGIFGIIVAALSPMLLLSCDGEDIPGNGKGQSVPEGMVEIRPVMSGTFVSIPRNPDDVASPGHVASRKYDDNATTDSYLKKTVRLPGGSTVWLFASGGPDNSLIKRSYVVYNSGDDENLSFLVPCTVDDEGKVINTESTPLYLKENTKYKFFAVSPARKLDEEQFREGKVAFQAYNGEYFYANDCRYVNTTPTDISISGENNAVQEVTLSPMINQTAELKFLIEKGEGVHDLDIQPSGIVVSGLQDDDPDGVAWHMSQTGDEPIDLKHGFKTGAYYQYNYTIDTLKRVQIDVPILPMWSISKPVIVVFRLKVNGVPTSYEMMLNEKDFKAGYSYGYRGKVSIKDGVDVITWQFVSWETEVYFPFD